MTSKAIEKYQVCQIIGHWIVRALKKEQHEEVQEYKILIQFCKSSSSKVWKKINAPLVCNILQKLDLERQDNIGLANRQVYEYLNPILYHYEHTPDAQRKF